MSPDWLDQQMLESDYDYERRQARNDELYSQWLEDQADDDDEEDGTPEELAGESFAGMSA